MQLWLEWFKCALVFRKACTRGRTFGWLVFALIGFSTLPDLSGVTGLARAAHLKRKFYHNFLHLFHSSALSLPLLTRTWILLVPKLFRPVLFRERPVVLLDGIKIAKEGKKMPGVKKLHQESANNSKAPYIFGHSLQVLALLVQSLTGQLFAISLISRIHEGITLSSQDKTSYFQKVHSLIAALTGPTFQKILLVADAFYPNRVVILPLLEKGHHLLSKVRPTSVAFEPPPPEPCKNGRKGRKRKYGKKVVLAKLWKNRRDFQTKKIAIYGKGAMDVPFLPINLIWKPIKMMVRFILVDHPEKGKMILISTDLEMPPEEAIQIYCARFKIEVSFKFSIHTIGAYAYKFWMKLWKPNKRREGDQDLSQKPEHYRKKALAKIEAYHRFIQLGIIGQGLLLHLAINFKKVVWREFPTWLRVMNFNRVPSEWVVAETLKFLLPGFLVGKTIGLSLRKFMADKIDVAKIWRMNISA